MMRPDLLTLTMKYFEIGFLASLLLIGGCAEKDEVRQFLEETYGLRRTCCVFLREEDDKVLGAGGFVAKEIGGRCRVFCLTARHVLTEWEYDDRKTAYFKNPGGMRISVAEASGGKRIWPAKIDPRRWRCADKEHDLAWLELNDEERREYAISAVSVGEDVMKGIHGGAEQGCYPGTVAVKMREYGSVGITNDTELVFLLPERKTMPNGTCVGTGRMTNILAKVRDIRLESVKMCFDRHHEMQELDTKQLMVWTKVTGGDSGAPVFAMGCVGGCHYPLLIGLVTGDLMKSEIPGASVCPFDEELNFLGASIARKLVECPQYQ